MAAEGPRGRAVEPPARAPGPLRSAHFAAYLLVVHDAASTAEVRLRADTRGRTADGPSIARQELQLRTSALAAGAATDLVVRTGGARIGAYTVTVDRDGRVRESNEANNTADITGPAPVG